MADEQTVSESTQAQTVQLFLNTIVSGMSIKDIRGVPDSVMEGIYAHAYQFYQSGRLENAEVFFRFLCLYDAFNPEYKFGLAATLQQKKQYEEAIIAYETMFALSKNDYRPQLHIGQCHLFMKNKKKAQEAFTAILEGDASASLKAQAQAYLGTIKPMETDQAIKLSEESHA